MSQTSWPDAGRGVPSSCFSHHPSRAATDAASRKQSPSKSQPGKWDPSRPSHPSGAGAYCLPAALATGTLVEGGRERQKGSFPRSQESQRRQMCQKPPLTAACLTGPSGPAQWHLPCQGHTFRSHVPQPDPLLEEPERPRASPSSPVKWAIGRIGGDRAVECLAHYLVHSKLMVRVPLWAAASSSPAPSPS